MKRLDELNILLNLFRVNNKDTRMAPIEVVLVFFIASKIVESGVFSGSYVPTFELDTDFYPVFSPNVGKY